MRKSGRRPRVLLVDDEPAILTLLCDFLDAEGFDVITSRDGVGALSAITEEPVDCVVLDIMMPGLSGFDVCRRLRATTDVPVLFLTARDDAGDKLRGFRLGADDYVVKATATPDEQAALEDERRMFIGAIAHDLHTPLFVLRGYLQGLENGIATTPQKTASYIAECRNKVDALGRLIADLFAYTKIEYLDQSLQQEPLDPPMLLVRTVAGLQPLAAEKGIVLSAAGPEAPYPIVGDRHLLTRAVENLVDNALRHTPQGGEIRVNWENVSRQFVFRVADTGPGIAAADLPHLFMPLYRGEASRNRQTGGAGLGLAIARRALQIHGGDLTAANRAAGGAVFTATLPFDRHAPESTGPTPAATDR
jgi:signal transduction histidine kinase